MIPLKIDATNLYWVCGAGDQWNDGSCWSTTPGGAGGAGQPTNNDSAFLVDSFTGSGYSVDYIGPVNPSDVLYYVEIDNTGSGGPLKLYPNLTGWNLKVQNETIGYNGQGSFDQIGGTHEVTDTLILGERSGSTGVYNMDFSGSLSANTEKIGDSGLGVFNQYDGAHTITTTMILGNTSGGEGQYNLSGGSTSTLNTSQSYIGNSGTGYFTQSGGKHKTSYLKLGSSSGIGQYDLSGGDVNAFLDIYVGDSQTGTGTFTQSGGTVTTQNLFIDYYGNTSTTSYYNISNGTFNSTTISNKDYFIVSGGVVTATSIIENDYQFFVSGGQVSASTIQNDYVFKYSGGTITADVTNNNYMELSNYGRFINGEIINNAGAKIKLKDTSLDNRGYTFTNYGILDSDPSVSYFSDFIIGNTGYILAGSGDEIYIDNDFTNQSTQDILWETSLAYLGFITGADSLHDFYIPGIDLGGETGSGYADNFDWGTLFLASGNTLNLFDGNGLPGGALYVRELLLEDGVSQISSIYGNGMNIYYNESLAANSYLAGQTYSLGGGGTLAPSVVPEPVSSILFVTGWAALGFRRFWKKRRMA